MVHTGFRFLAREHELDRLRRRLDATLAGRGGVVVLSGAPGVGSTTLARQVAERAAQLGCEVLWGRCVEGTLDRPFGGLAEALELHASSLPADTVQADLAGDVGPILRICPALTAKVSTFSPAVPLEPADERLRLNEAIVGWLERMARRAPLLVVTDDFQLADGDLRGLVEHLARRLRDAPVLLLCVRTTALPRRRWPRMRGALETLELEGLDEGATAALLSAVADRPITPAVVALVQRVSRGAPLLSVELYRHLLEENLLPGLGAITLPMPASLPQTLEEVVAWRVARLPAATRAALHVLAAFPRGAEAPVVATLAGLVRARAADALEALVADGLATLNANGTQYQVAHPAVRRVLLDGLSAVLRAQLYRRLAETLEVDAGERRRELAGTLAHHWSESYTLPGGERGLGHCLVAAEQARAAYAHQRMVDCLRAALKVAPQDARTQLDLHSRLATAEAGAGLASEALASARRVLELGEAETPRHVSLRAEAISAVTDALRLLRGSGVAAADWPQIDALRAKALFALGVQRSARADLLPGARLELLAESWQELQLGPVAVLHWGDLQTSAANVLAQGNEADRAEVVLPQRPRARADTANAAQSARVWRRPSATLRALASTVTDLVTRHGMFGEGAGWATQYLAAAGRDGSPRDQIAALLLLARCQIALGEFGAADDSIGRADAQLDPLPERDRVEWQVLEDELTMARWSMAHFRDANWRSLIKALPAPDVYRPAGLLIAAMRTLGQARLGNEAEARAFLPLVLAAVGEVAPLTLYRDSALVAILTVAWEMGAAEHVATGQSLLELAMGAGVGGQVQGTIELSQARLLALAGQVDQARTIFAKQRDVLEAAGLRPLRAMCDHDEAIAIAAAGSGGYDEAAHLLQAALAAFERLGMSGWAARVEQLLAGGLEAAAAPGGRLAFTYPRGLSRPEADAVRLLAAGTSMEEAARMLALERLAMERLLKSALAKLGGKALDQLPQLARRYGLGGL